ncbi:MAG TPA: TonB-dependent receptor, partial [Bacteroidota bacterium]|nr:TonB-dependent receptor [Bacteroidota bacterium]
VFTPGSIDPPNFQFAGDTLNNYLLAEDRSFTTTGIRSTYDLRLSHSLLFKFGINLSSTTGTESFTSRDSAGNPGPSIVTNFSGSDFGVFAQTDLHPLEWTSFELGLRYDQHQAPDVSLQSQVSPRIRWNFFIDEDNSGYLYFGKMFVPTNVEGLRSIAANVSTTLVPTLPERDDFYEAVYTHLFPFGLRSKAAVYYEYSSPGVDDQTIGSSAIKTPVNIEEVHTTGIEFGVSYNDPSTPFSGYLNASIIHAYGVGTISGGFLPFDTDGPATDLDHDQRLSVVAGLNYQPSDWFSDITVIYGSGLANGNPGGVPYQTGLFDFNTAQHTDPSVIINVGAGYTFRLSSGATLQPSLYITNLFDNEHLIKGAYFSGASWEEPRNVVFKVAVHI